MSRCALWMVTVLARVAHCGCLRVPRRRTLSLVAGAAFSLTAAPAAQAVIGGAAVTAKAAAQVGAVALWIDLEGCEICRHDVPAACSGVLIADDLVLSAQHCIDVPEELHGQLTKVVFGADIFEQGVVSVPVAAYLRPVDVGLKLAGDGALANDLVLIKLASAAPASWRRVSLGAPGDEPGVLRASLYGFGDTVEDDEDYSSGRLQRLDLAAITPRRRDLATFFTKPLDARQGSCNGDSGGALIRERKGQPPEIVGVLSANTLPCAGSTARFTDASFFSEFIKVASQRLGSPIDIYTL